MIDHMSKIDDPKEFASEFERMRIREAVLKNVTTAEPRRKSEQSIRVKEEFTLPWGEFVAMSKRELWDKYVNELARRLILRGKRAVRSGRGIKFFRPTLPASTMNRKVVTFDKDGVFIVLIAQRTRVQVNRSETFQDVVEITIGAEIEKI